MIRTAVGERWFTEHWRVGLECIAGGGCSKDCRQDKILHEHG